MTGVQTCALPISIDAGARVELADGKLALGGIAGSIAGAKVAGDLSGVADASAGNRMRFSGAMTIDRASLPALAALVLGPAQAPRAGAVWSDARFATGLADMPLADVKMKAGEFALSDALVARETTFTLSLAPGLLRFDDFAGKLGGATIDGRMALRRDEIGRAHV